MGPPQPRPWHEKAAGMGLAIVTGIFTIPSCPAGAALTATHNRPRRRATARGHKTCLSR